MGKCINGDRLSRIFAEWRRRQRKTPGGFSEIEGEPDERFGERCAAYVFELADVCGDNKKAGESRARVVMD